MSRRGVRRGLLLGGVAGLLIVLVLVAWVGLGSVAASVAAIGWDGFLAFAACWLAVLSVLGLAWAAVAPGGPVRLFVWGRMLREAAADILPFSQLGGFIVGARGVIAAGAPRELVFASSLVDVTAELFAQVLYTLIGLVFLATRLAATSVTPAVLWAVLASLVALFAAAIAAFLAGQGPAVRWLARLVARWLPDYAGGADDVGEAVLAIYRRPARVALGVGLHVAAWIGSSAVSWFALRLMGVSIALQDVIALESLMYAVRNVAFALPAGLGVQEAAYVLLGPVFGLHAGDALALSLLKRGRDIVIGAPVMAAWQLMEARSLLRRRRKLGPAP
jgi:putative membrane protein